MKRRYWPSLLVLLVCGTVVVPEVHADIFNRAGRLPDLKRGLVAGLASGPSASMTAREALQSGENPARVGRALLSAGVPAATVQSALVAAGGHRSSLHVTTSAGQGLGWAPQGFAGGQFHDGRLHDVLLFKLRLIKKILGGIFPGFPPSPH